MPKKNKNKIKVRNSKLIQTTFLSSQPKFSIPQTHLQIFLPWEGIVFWGKNRPIPESISHRILLVWGRESAEIDWKSSNISIFVSFFSKLRLSNSNGSHGEARARTQGSNRPRTTHPIWPLYPLTIPDPIPRHLHRLRFPNPHLHRNSRRNPNSPPILS